MSFNLFKSLNLVVFLLFFVSLGFSVKVMDLNGEHREFFSYNIPDIVIETSNISNQIILSYNLNNKIINDTYNLTSCVLNSSNNCLELNIFNFIKKTNNSIQASLRYDIYFQNETNHFYLDLNPPRFDFLNYSINKSIKKIDINFNYIDDFNISKVDLFYINISNNSSKFLASLLNKTNFSFDILDENFKLKVEIKDDAENELIKEKEFKIEDIFEPEILSYNIYEDLDNNLKLNLSLRDNVLVSKVSLKFSDMEINLYPNQSIYVNDIQLPKKENFKLFVFDNNSNIKEKDFNILNSFDFNRIKEYSNKKEFLINILADECKLILLNGNLESKDFIKQNPYSFKLDLNNFNLNEGKINLKFVCSLNNYSKEFESYFYYDTTSPSNVELEVEKLDDGRVKLSWSSSKDNLSDVKYYIFKNGEKITSTGREGFYDTDVLYPNEYEYYLEIKDLAGNKVISNKVKVIPKKIRFNFKTNIDKNEIKVNNSNFDLNLDLDEGSKVEIVLKNETGNIIYNKSIINSPSNLKISLNLTKGKNVLEIRGVDVENTTKEFLYNIYYEKPKPILNKVEKKEENNTLIKKNEIGEIDLNSSKINESNLNTLNNLGGNNNFYYFWIILLIILILLLAFYYGYLSKKDLSIRRKKDEQDFMKGIFSSSNSKNDIYLEKEIKKNKELLIKKKEEMNKIKNKEKNKKELSAFKKGVLKDISKKEKLDLENIIKKEKKEVRNNKKSSNKKKLNLVNPFVVFKKNLEERKRKEKKEFEKREDPLNKYLENVVSKRNKAWNSTKEYLLKTKLEKEEKKRKKEEEKRKEMEEKQKEREEKERKKQLELEKKQKELEEKRRFKEERKIAKNSLDDYLKDKSKKRGLFFAEKEVNSLFKKK